MIKGESMAMNFGRINLRTLKPVLIGVAVAMAALVLPVVSKPLVKLTTAIRDKIGAMLAPRA